MVKVKIKKEREVLLRTGIFMSSLVNFADER